MKKDGPFPKTNSKNTLKIGSNPKKNIVFQQTIFQKLLLLVLLSVVSVKDWGLNIESWKIYLWKKQTDIRTPLAVMFSYLDDFWGLLEVEERSFRTTKYPVQIEFNVTLILKNVGMSFCGIHV